MKLTELAKAIDEKFEKNDGALKERLGELNTNRLKVFLGKELADNLENLSDDQVKNIINTSVDVIVGPQEQVGKEKWEIAEKSVLEKEIEKEKKEEKEWDPIENLLYGEDAEQRPKEEAGDVDVPLHLRKVAEEVVNQEIKGALPKWKNTTVTKNVNQTKTMPEARTPSPVAEAQTQKKVSRSATAATKVSQAKETLSTKARTITQAQIPVPKAITTVTKGITKAKRELSNPETPLKVRDKISSGISSVAKGIVRTQSFLNRQKKTVKPRERLNSMAHVMAKTIPKPDINKMVEKANEKQQGLKNRAQTMKSAFVKINPLAKKSNVEKSTSSETTLRQTSEMQKETSNLVDARKEIINGIVNEGMKGVEKGEKNIVEIIKSLKNEKNEIQESYSLDERLQKDPLLKYCDEKLQQMTSEMNKSVAKTTQDIDKTISEDVNKIERREKSVDEMIYDLNIKKDGIRESTSLDNSQKSSLLDYCDKKLDQLPKEIVGNNQTSIKESKEYTASLKNEILSDAKKAQDESSSYESSGPHP